MPARHSASVCVGSGVAKPPPNFLFAMPLLYVGFGGGEAAPECCVCDALPVFAGQRIAYRK